jgi:protein-tyrosine phosphatase
MCHRDMGPRFYEVELIGSGFLAVMAKPVAGDWVDDEFSGLAAAGIRKVVSLLESSESYEVGLADESSLCRKHDMEFVSYPIPDRGLPSSVIGFAQFTRTLYREIAGGKSTVVHCRAGIGRTGVVAAAVLLHAAFTPEDAFARISKVRGVKVPDTDEQYQWVVDHFHDITSDT